MSTSAETPELSRRPGIYSQICEFRYTDPTIRAEMCTVWLQCIDNCVSAKSGDGVIQIGKKVAQDLHSTLTTFLYFTEISQINDSTRILSGVGEEVKVRKNKQESASMTHESSVMTDHAAHSPAMGSMSHDALKRPECIWAKRRLICWMKRERQVSGAVKSVLKLSKTHQHKYKLSSSAKHVISVD